MLWYIICAHLILLNMWMFSFLTIPFYKLLCNLGYIDDWYLETLLSTHKELWTTFFPAEEDSTMANTSILHNMVHSYATFMRGVLYQYSMNHMYTLSLNMQIEDLMMARSGLLTECFEIKFITGVSSSTLSEFICLHDSILVVPGESTLAFFRIYNPMSFEISGISLYYIPPSDCAFDVKKLQCLCFDKVLLQGNETLDLPVLFYLDPDVVSEFNVIYISYIFFIQN